MTKTKRILALILTFVMMLLVVAPLSSCGGTTCTSHVDANGDGICDTAGCGAVVSPATKTNYVVRVQTLGGYYP